MLTGIYDSVCRCAACVRQGAVGGSTPRCGSNAACVSWVGLGAYLLPANERKLRCETSKLRGKISGMSVRALALDYQPNVRRAYRISGKLVVAILLALFTWMPFVSGKAAMSFLRSGEPQIRLGQRRGRRLMGLAVALIWANWIVSPLIVMTLAFTLTIGHENAKSALSHANLRNIAFNLRVYAQHNKGYLPADLDKVVDRSSAVTQFFRSPKGNPAKPAVMLANGPCDYIYAPPAVRPGSAENCRITPVIYEPPANYKYSRTIVGFADGHVEIVRGQRMMDLVAEVDAARAAAPQPSGKSH